MKLIIGLGNPGKKYETTRHNIGFIIADELAKYFNVKIDTPKFKGYYAKFKYKGEDIYILKPQTYMNLSGESVSEIMRYFKIDISDIIVICDDLDLDVGRIRIRTKGSSGGHNGLKSIEQYLQSSDFGRLKFGIGKNKFIPVEKYVIGNFSPDEINTVINQAIVARDALIDYLDKGIGYAMNNYNR